MKKYIFVGIAVIITLILCSYFFINDTCIVTYCDEDYKCNTIQEKARVNKLFNKYKDYQYVRVDVIINEHSITEEDLNGEIEQVNDYRFKYGLNINDKIRFLSEQVNTNSLISFDNDKINKSNLTYYAEQKGVTIETSDFNHLKVFGTKTYYKEKGGNKVKLENNNGYNIKIPQDNELDDVISLSTNKLLNMLKDDGSFIYGYYANTGKKIGSYNVLRHAGAIYSLIKYYEYTKDDNIRQYVEKGINYLLSEYLVKYNKKTSFIVEKKSSEIKLGGNALTLLALTEYQLAYNDPRYYDTASKIAEGILFCLQEDGSYNHVLNLDYTLKEKTRTTYYDGEATYALLNLYKLSKDDKYLEAAKKTVNMFIREDYTQYKDQWVGYSMYNILQYDMNNNYIAFTLNNFTKNDFYEIKDFKPINLELLMNIYESYMYLKEKDSDNIYFKNFKIDELKKTIKYHRDLLLSYYVSDYYAMFFEKPTNTRYGFMSIESDYRMRIDDIQHSISGLMLYSKMCKEK